jgi:hypothetical protein
VRVPGPRLVLWLALACLPLAAPRARAAGEPDSVGGYLRALADSTDQYFGESAAPVDTAGLDSALAYGLTHPTPPHRRDWKPSFGPWVSFDRVDGALWGGSLGWGEVEEIGHLSGRYGYAAGPNEGRWAARYQKAWDPHHVPAGARRARRREEGPRWSLDVTGGRLTSTLDRDHRAHFFRVARALLNGSDRDHYLLREGASVGLEAETGIWRLGVTYRNELESPLVTTTTWDLLHRPLVIVPNQAAAQGRAGEISTELGARWPRWGVQVEGSVATAADALGSDFTYTRSRFAIGAERPLGKLASLVPQFEYGRLTGDAIPQASFFLGGSHALRSIEGESLGGTVKALARLDLYFPHDLLALAHIPHPALLPIEAGAFGGLGAVSGTDPYGGPAVAGSSWPDASAWHSEAGIGLLWRPGLPDPTKSFRFDLAWHLGADHGRHFSVAYSAPLDLFRPFE